MSGLIQFLMIYVVLFDCMDASKYDEIYARQSSNQWFKDGVNLIRGNIGVKNFNKKANGVVLFLGDGMGITTVTAARILDGQLRNETGEENQLSWETFPNAALSKTYNTNQQVPDSAGTATAIMTGVKSKSRVISMNENVTVGDCQSQSGKNVLSLLMLAEQSGLSTGVVTNSRITHATPATSYAHVSVRYWESDADINTKNKACPDIARQLIEFPYGDGVDVALGGGRNRFLKKQQGGKRKDDRDLTNEWKKKSSLHKYVRNNTQFKELDPNTDEKVLGLFSESHMEYEYLRKDEEPSLTEMVDFAIKKLSRNKRGFFLLVEGGKIDHGHHMSQPILALHEAVELNKAVQKAKEITSSSDTLLVVTADHSHVFTIGGYPKRGNDIFGRSLTYDGSLNAEDQKKFQTLSYTNGPGKKLANERYEETDDEIHDATYKRQSLVRLSSESHGGEDVGIYSHGPQAHLLRGVVEQNYIFHVIDYALCLSQNKKEICTREGLIGKSSGNSLQAASKFHSFWLVLMPLYVVGQVFFCDSILHVISIKATKDKQQYNITRDI